LQIKGIIVISILLLGSCTVLKVNKNNALKEANSDNDILYSENIENYNISSNSFYIQKVIIKIEEADRRQEFIGNLKYESKDRFLISVRSVAGIEFVRIYFNNDSIFVMDRINKTIYEGNETSFYRKYGIKKDFLFILLGDIISSKGTDNEYIKGNIKNTIIKRMSGNLEIEYKYSNEQRKAISSEIKEHNKSESIKINYNNFRRIDGNFFPQKIDINNFHEYKKLSLLIKKIEIPWDGEIRFIKVKEYNLVKI
jgi:hypothetical protein